uniref:Basic tail secreted protein n=1 Tax=Rhipicephalus zambeziensis TaxID=60191 RepID=A0A224YAQ4_9ACAR
MDVTLWCLALFIISGVVFPEAQTVHSTPLFCHRLMPRSPYHGNECSYPCALSRGHPSNSYGILYLAEEDWTPCSVGHCRSGACVPAQDHAMKRQKRSILLTLGALRLGKRIMQRIQGRSGNF